MFFLIFIGNYHWLTTSEKALKCQRRVTESDSQPEPHPVGWQNAYAPAISKQSKGTPDNPFMSGRRGMNTQACADTG
jgi:hypothetical protein